MTFQRLARAALAPPRTLADGLAERTNDLAAVRLLAAAAVLLAHAWLVTAEPNAEVNDRFRIFGFTADFHAVHAFFVLSGLLLTWSLIRRPDAARFIVARLLRYIPAIAVSALIATLLIGPFATRLGLADYFASSQTWRFLFGIVTLEDVNATLPGAFEASGRPGILYVPLWTVHYELVFSICLAVVAALGLLKRRWLVLAGLIVTLTVDVLWFWRGDSLASLGSVHHLVRFASAFGIGIALAVFAGRIPVSKRILAILAVLAAPLAYSHVASLAGLLLLSYAILCIGFARVPLSGPLARLGLWSYGFYVSGMLIEQCFAALFPDWSGLAVFAASFVVALAAGALSWIFIERPALSLTDPATRLVKRIGAGRASTPPAYVAADPARVREAPAPRPRAR